MSLIELKVDRIQYSETQTGAYVLFLKEPLSDKKLPIVIGGMEAHSITIGMEKDIVPQRPLTHDLMKNMMNEFGINLKKIIINKFDQGIFYAILITEKDGKETAIDSRTSDAVALAVRFEAPIYCQNEILEEAGIFLPGESIGKQQVEKELQMSEDIEKILEKIDEVLEPALNFDEEPQQDDEITELEQLSLDLFGKRKVNYSKKEIENMMQTAIEEEQYERAGMLKRFIELSFSKE